MSKFVLLHATAVCHVLKLDERCGTGCDLIITVVCHGPSAQHTDGTAYRKKAQTYVCHATFAPHFLSQVLLCHMKVKRMVLQNDSLLNVATATKRKYGGKI